MGRRSGSLLGQEQAKRKVKVAFHLDTAKLVLSAQLRRRGERIMADRPNQKRNKQVLSEDELKRRHQRWMAGLAAGKSLFTTAIIGLFVWLCFHSMFYLPIAVAHGETTTISVAQNWLANINASVYVAWGAAATGITYGELQRRKRTKERAAKDSRIAELETQIDPGRTSSGLTPGGESARGV